MRRILFVILLALYLAAPTAAQSAPLSIVLSVSQQDQLRPGQRVHVVAFIFATTPTTSTLTLQAPSWATLDQASPAQLTSTPERPGELHAVLTVAADAPVGAAGVVQACAGAVCARAGLRVGGVVWPPPRQHLWLPIMTRGSRH